MSAVLACIISVYVLCVVEAADEALATCSAAHAVRHVSRHET